MNPSMQGYNQRRMNQRPRSQNPNARRIRGRSPLNQIPGKNPYPRKGNNYNPPGVEKRK